MAQAPEARMPVPAALPLLTALLLLGCGPCPDYAVTRKAEFGRFAMLDKVLVRAVKEFDFGGNGFACGPSHETRAQDYLVDLSTGTRTLLGFTVPRRGDWEVSYGKGMVYFGGHMRLRVDLPALDSLDFDSAAFADSSREYDFRLDDWWADEKALLTVRYRRNLSDMPLDYQDSVGFFLTGREKGSFAPLPIRDVFGAEGRCLALFSAGDSLHGAFLRSADTVDILSKAFGGTVVRSRSLRLPAAFNAFSYLRFRRNLESDFLNYEWKDKDLIGRYHLDLRTEIWRTDADIFRLLHLNRAGLRKFVSSASKDARVLAIIDTVAGDTLRLDFSKEIERL